METSNDRVFVYGMLLDPAMTRVPGYAAQISGWRLNLDGNLATVSPAPGEVLHGAVLEIDPRRLDQFEGVNPYDPSSVNGLYRRVQFYTDADELVHIYLKNWDGETMRGFETYVETIRRGYQHWHLPERALDAAVARHSYTEERYGN